MSLKDIVECIQGGICVNACFEDADVCERIPTCPLRDHLAQLQGELDAWLEDLTLTEIVADFEAEGEHAHGTADVSGTG